MAWIYTYDNGTPVTRTAIEELAYKTPRLPTAKPIKAAVSDKVLPSKAVSDDRILYAE
jgi:hypothetical protein